MFNVEVVFRYLGKPSEPDISQGVNGLLGAWIQNGQVLSGDVPITFSRTACRAVVSCPEADSFASRHANKWVPRVLAELASHGLRRPTFRPLGRGLESPDADRCRRPAWYVLITDSLSVESPLRCGQHYLPVPLYRIPHTDHRGDNYQDILSWQRISKDCDEIEIESGPGERFAIRQISDVASPLSLVGRKVCGRIEKVSGVPTYYYLSRGQGRSAASERKRPCPSCGGKWLLEVPVHIFDFKCDRCRLVSNVAWGCA